MKKIQRKIQKNNEKIQRKLKKEGEKKNPPGFTKSPSYNCLILKISFQKIKIFLNIPKDVFLFLHQFF